jgi:hypothetical protein
MSQRELTNQSVEQHAHHYVSTCNPQQLKALKASQECGANDIITVRPNREETTLSDNEMKFAVRQRLTCLPMFGQYPQMSRTRSVPRKQCKKRSQASTLQAAVTTERNDMTM